MGARFHLGDRFILEPVLLGVRFHLGAGFHLGESSLLWGGSLSITNLFQNKQASQNSNKNWVDLTHKSACYEG